VDLLLQFWLVVFHYQQVVALLIDDLLSHVSMGEHRVAGADLAF
jgi:hypothetical protein